MILKAEQLVDVMLALQAQRQVPSRTDKRKNARIGTHYRVDVRPLLGHTGATGPAVKAWLRDVSAGGVGLQVSGTMVANEPFVLELPRVNGESLDIMCVVTHCQQVAPTCFHIGARYLVEWLEEAAVGRPGAKAKKSARPAA